MNALALLGVAWLALATTWSVRAARRWAAEERSVRGFRRQEEVLARASTRCGELGGAGDIEGISKRVDAAVLPESAPVLDAEPKPSQAPDRQRRPVDPGRFPRAHWQGRAA